MKTSLASFYAAFCSFLVIAFVFPGRTEEKKPSVEITVSLVNVWVKALDGSGASVKDLKASDFQITEDGKPCCISGVGRQERQSVMEGCGHEM